MQGVTGRTATGPGKVASRSAHVHVVKPALENDRDHIGNLFGKIQPIQEDRVQFSALQTKI